MSIEELEWIKPEIVNVVNTFESMICIILLISKEQFWIKFAPIIKHCMLSFPFNVTFTYLAFQSWQRPCGKVGIMNIMGFHAL
jgi:hypothetical protein